MCTGLNDTLHQVTYYKDIATSEVILNRFVGTQCKPQNIIIDVSLNTLANAKCN